jgi:hypothetical protein
MNIEWMNIEWMNIEWMYTQLNCMCVCVCVCERDCVYIDIYMYSVLKRRSEKSLK